MSVVGFDIGHETCYIAVARAGGIEVIDNEYSSRMTPSYVGFTEKSRDLGVSAKLKLTSNINNTIFGFKTLLGKKLSNAKSDLNYLPFNVCELPSDEIGVVVKYLNENTLFSMQQVMAMMLTKLKSLAEVKLESEVRECVISVPVFYTDIQRRAMLDAAEIAGLKALKLMNEPTSIALTYGFYKQHLFDQPKTVVFVDLGQYALTITAGVFVKGKQTILGSAWNTNVGGRDFDLVLAQYFAKQFKSQYNIDVMTNKKALMTLILECETLKKQMSMNSRSLHLNIECLVNDVDVCGKMNREKFEDLSSQLLLGVENTMRDLLAEVELDKNDIYEVQVVGGSCRLPALRTIIFEVFGQYPLATLNQDEAVARGCALQCAILSPTLKTKEYIIEDIQPFSIKVSTFHKNTASNELEVFPRFHKSPACKNVTYNCNNPFYLKAFYSDVSLRISDIGKYTFSDIPSDIGDNFDVLLKAKLTLDINGIFSVTSAQMDVPDIQDVLSKQMAIVLYDEHFNRSQEEKHIHDAKSSEIGDSVENENENPRETIESFVLNIQSDVSSLSKLELNQLINKELLMIMSDLQEKKRADLRNAVEEYVYHSREKLSEDLKTFVSDDETVKCLDMLNETEDWLYDSDNQSADDYLQKMDELKSSFEPIRNRFREFQNVKLALDEFENVLALSISNIQVLSCKDYGCAMDEGDIKCLEALWDQKKECFDQCLYVLNDECHRKQLPISADTIRAEIYDLENKMKNIINKNFISSKVVQGENSVIRDQPNEPNQ